MAIFDIHGPSTAGAGARALFEGFLIRQQTPGVEISDSIPPVFTVISPAAGTPVDPDQVLIVEITDNVRVALAPLYAEFPNVEVAEMVYDGTNLKVPYAALSSVVDLGNGGRRLSLRRTGGWPGAVSLTSIATDTGGNEVV